jgi:hypothetical protein
MKDQVLHAYKMTDELYICWIWGSHSGDCEEYDFWFVISCSVDLYRTTGRSNPEDGTKLHFRMRPEVSTAVKCWIVAFCVLTSSSAVGGYRCFGRIRWLSLQHEVNNSIIEK